MASLGAGSSRASTLGSWAASSQASNAINCPPNPPRQAGGWHSAAPAPFAAVYVMYDSCAFTAGKYDALPWYLIEGAIK